MLEKEKVQKGEKIDLACFWSNLLLRRLAFLGFFLVFVAAKKRLGIFWC